MKNILKYALLLTAAAMSLSCEGMGEGTGTGSGSTSKSLTIESDKNLIQTFGGDYATITVTLNGEPVTEGVTFYRNFDKKDEPIAAEGGVVQISDFKFTTENVGEHVIWANYGTYFSNKITIKAVSVAIPETPQDQYPERTDFKARVLLTEFTTVGCEMCPAMKVILHDVAKDAAMADKVLFTECHSGLINSVADPCFLYNKEFENWSMITGYPTVNMDLTETLINRGEINDAINVLLALKQEIAPGIAVNAKLENETIVAKVTVKAKVDDSYRIGAYLLEDGIYARQYGPQLVVEEWMHTHDNVIRYVDSQYKAQFYGHPLADIKAGKTADAVFSWILDDIWEYGSNKGLINGGTAWPERDNSKLHMLVFVCGTDGRGGYRLVNAIDCPVNGITPYEYR